MASSSDRARELAGDRCRRLGLRGTRFTSPSEVVHGLLAVQAQEHAFSRWSLAQRLESCSDGDVRESLASAEIVRVHALRPTWHYLRGADLGWVQRLTGGIVIRNSAGWYRSHGVDEEFLAATKRELERSLGGGRAKTRKQLRDEFTAAGLDVSGQRLAAALMDAELSAFICSGPIAGKQHTYALVEERLGSSPELAAEEATAKLVQRYLAGHAPATLKDLRWWSGLTLKRLRAAVEDLGEAVVTERVGDVEFLRPAAEPAPVTGEGPQFQLLQVFDELFVGYQESRRLVDPDGEFGAVLPIGYTRMMHVVVEFDRLVGRWRSDKEGDRLKVSAEIGRPLSESDVEQLRYAAKAYGAFVGLEAALALDNTR